MTLFYPAEERTGSFSRLGIAAESGVPLSERAALIVISAVCVYVMSLSAAG